MLLPTPRPPAFRIHLPHLVEALIRVIDTVPHKPLLHCCAGWHFHRHELNRVICSRLQLPGLRGTHQPHDVRVVRLEEVVVPWLEADAACRVDQVTGGEVGVYQGRRLRDTSAIVDTGYILIILAVGVNRPGCADAVGG